MFFVYLVAGILAGAGTVLYLTLIQGKVTWQVVKQIETTPLGTTYQVRGTRPLIGLLVWEGIVIRENRWGDVYDFEGKVKYDLYFPILYFENELSKQKSIQCRKEKYLSSIDPRTGLTLPNVNPAGGTQ